ncbi:hypothetical protein L226DRAFT_574649 [Lentinus tigrinus ALCF2SS1-7]|uniref:Transmembrane protein n=1 Tax=Lentinus tigrinus ALCF2SS1-6 TaxID=1328759 RepID=A0A5C2RR36_9APHY|nr:hypothetical protein L227DRAFT_616759 [Lentinus tigrinus ALCF2SS1-6]RPD70539.1 hypothetical protein L226DRAFT_574649 [Lentinus tigrinus ALCF2SS1-7]
MTLSVDRVLPSDESNSLDLAEIFAYAVAYGLYLTLSTIALVPIVICNDTQLHAVVYLPLAVISQALIFITCLHGFYQRLGSRLNNQRLLPGKFSRSVLPSSFAALKVVSQIIR